MENDNYNIEYEYISAITKLTEDNIIVWNYDKKENSYDTVYKFDTNDKKKDKYGDIVDIINKYEVKLIFLINSRYFYLDSYYFHDGCVIAYTSFTIKSKKTDAENKVSKKMKELYEIIIKKDLENKERDKKSAILSFMYAFRKMRN